MQPAPLRIGLSAAFMHADPERALFKGKTLKYVEQQLAQWVTAEGALTYMIPVPPASQPHAIDAYAQDLDALVLQGGVDVSPASYGETPLRPEWAGDALRDAYEIALIRAFMNLGKPVFGICRGLQILNVALGGSLYQDINTQLPGSFVHRDWHVYDQNFHYVRLQHPSHLAQLYPDTVTARVCSVHHQAVKDLAGTLVAEAYSMDDHIVEAARHTGEGWAYGVQWHPEWHDPTQTALMDGRVLLRDFLAAARARRTSSPGA